jgi:hypothetical protein
MSSLSRTKIRGNTMELALAHKNQLKIEAMDLVEGQQTYNIKCPICEQSTSFAVKRDGGGLLYKCFRAQCGVEGYVPSKATVPAAEGTSPVIRDILSLAKKPAFKCNPYMGKLQKLPREVRKFLRNSYQIGTMNTQTYGYRYNLVSDRLYMPINNLWGMETGAVMKKLPSSAYQGAKAINYWVIDDPIRLHFPPTGITDTGTIVVVEDILSASKLAPVIRSCALLGHSMSRKQAAFLASHFDKMIVLLDPDATDGAMKIASSFGGMFTDGIGIRVLKKDPKDIPLVELEEALLPPKPEQVADTFTDVDDYSGC